MSTTISATPIAQQSIATSYITSGDADDFHYADASYNAYLPTFESLTLSLQTSTSAASITTSVPKASVTSDAKPLVVPTTKSNDEASIYASGAHEEYRGSGNSDFEFAVADYYTDRTDYEGNYQLE
jgi:hypothetical protein